MTIVTVTFNSLDVLPSMLASVPAGAATVIVDNASLDVPALRALAEARAATLLELPRNLGFGVGCNRGAALAKTEFMLFLNPDATLAPDTIDHLVAAARRYPDAVAMNPRIVAASGKPCFKHRSRLLPRRAAVARGWPDADCEVPVLSGAALFVRRADFEAVGGFDPNIFLYHEDDDLALRLCRERGAIMFIRDALVTHLEGRSTPRGPQSAAFKGWHLARSRVYAARKHARPLPFAFALAAALFALIAPDTVFSGRRRAKNWAMLQGTLSTLRDGGATSVDPK